MMEYIIEAHDTEDMRQWLSSVKYCMRFNSDGTTDETEYVLSTQFILKFFDNCFNIRVKNCNHLSIR